MINMEKIIASLSGEKKFYGGLLLGNCLIFSILFFSKRIKDIISNYMVLGFSGEKILWKISLFFILLNIYKLWKSD